MSTPTLHACPLGLDPERLGLYRDGGLGAAETEHITAHLGTCATCQACLADFEVGARLLRAQRVPVPDERLWRNVRAGLETRPRRRGTGTSPTARQTLTTLGTLAAIVLLVVGFAWLLNRAGSSPATPAPTATAPATLTPTPTATPTTVPTAPPQPKLAWQPITTPPGFDPRKQSTNIFMPSPADGTTAFACAEPGDAPNIQHPSLWVTHDLGAHWRAVTNLPADTTGWCSLITDQLDPQIVLLGLAPEAAVGGPPGADHYVASLDGGATWQVMSGLNGIDITELATAGGTTYALGYGPRSAMLYASHDGLRSWRPAMPSDSPVAQSMRFWLDPTSGALLVQAGASPQQLALYQSTNGGASWTPLRGAGMPTSGSVVVRPLVAGQPWHICGGSYDDTTAASRTYTVTCSDDGGHTWAVRAEWTAETGPQSTFTFGFVYANDGSLLTTDYVMNSGPASYRLWRLALGATRWGMVDSIVQLGLAYSSQPAPGRLWAVPTPMMGSGDPQGRIFSAVYGG